MTVICYSKLEIDPLMFSKPFKRKNSPGRQLERDIPFPLGPPQHNPY